MPYCSVCIQRKHAFTVLACIYTREHTILPQFFLQDCHKSYSTSFKKLNSNHLFYPRQRTSPGRVGTLRDECIGELCSLLRQVQLAGPFRPRQCTWPGRVGTVRDECIGELCSLLRQVQLAGPFPPRQRTWPGRVPVSMLS